MLDIYSGGLLVYICISVIFFIATVIIQVQTGDIYNRPRTTACFAAIFWPFIVTLKSLNFVADNVSHACDVWRAR